MRCAESREVLVKAGFSVQRVHAHVAPDVTVHFPIIWCLMENLQKSVKRKQKIKMLK